MANSYKREIGVGEVVPNAGNPRRDFGDLGALAASMATNGGEPFSPIIVVPDGGKYRLVDGERRWRAMVELGTERCDALVFQTMGEAEAAVAMMATDDSKALDERERLRGFQSMLALGVDDEGVASVTGTDAETVRRARRYAHDLPEQATLDGLIAAAHDEFSDEERARILKECGNPWGDPEREADRIRKAHEREARLRSIREALPEGVEVGEGARPSEYTASRDGLVYVTKVASEGAARRLADRHDGEEGLVAYEDGIGYAVYRTADEGAVDEREAEAARVRRERDEHKEAYDAAFREMCLWATEPWWRDEPAYRGRTPASRRPNLCDAVMAERMRDYGPYRSVLSEEAHEVLGVAASFAEDEDPSCLEVCQWLVGNRNHHGLYGWNGDLEVQGRSAREYALTFDTLLLDGYQPGEGATAIREMCPKEEDGS